MPDYRTPLDKTISQISSKLNKIKYSAIKAMTEEVARACPNYSLKVIRKAIIYYYFE